MQDLANLHYLVRLCLTLTHTHKLTRPLGLWWESLIKGGTKCLLLGAIYVGGLSAPITYVCVCKWLYLGFGQCIYKDKVGREKVGYIWIFIIKEEKEVVGEDWQWMPEYENNWPELLRERERERERERSENVRKWGREPSNVSITRGRGLWDPLTWPPRGTVRKVKVCVTNKN